MNNTQIINKRTLLKLSIAILLVGIGAGAASHLLHISVNFLTNLMKTSEVFSYKTYIYSYLCLLFSYCLTKFFFKDTNGSGIPQVKLSLIAFKGKMPKRMPFGKFVTSLLTISSGLSFGKEGPLVTISAAWAHLVSHFLGLNRQLTKLIVSSGAAAGLAAAFNTPIAAVVFTIEEILGELNTKYLGPVILTSVIGAITSIKLSHGHMTFTSLNYGFKTEWHLVIYLVLGLLMSLLGLAFVRTIVFMKNIKKKYFINLDFLFILIVVVITGLSSQISPNVLGDGIVSINELLNGKNFGSLSLLISVFVLKFLLSTTSYSTGLSGGLFMPVLFLGALGGYCMGEGLQWLGVPKIETGVFALLGMTSLLVSVIRTPFTAFVMLFEMTRDYDLILPLMISSISAYWISTLFVQESVYETVAEYEGVHIPTHKDNECMEDMSVSECMKEQVTIIDPSVEVHKVASVLLENTFGGFPVVKEGKLMGVVNRCDLEEALRENPNIHVRDLLRYSTISIYPDQSLLVAMDRMKRFEIARLPVVSRVNDKKLLGIITPEDIIKYLDVSKDTIEHETIEDQGA